MPASPSSSADLAAELAPGLLLADDAQDPSFEPANIDSETDGDDDDEEEQPACGPAATQPSLVTRSAMPSSPGAMHLGNIAVAVPSALARMAVLKSTARKTANPGHPAAPAADAAAAAVAADATDPHDAAVDGAGAPDKSQQALPGQSQDEMLEQAVKN